VGDHPLRAIFGSETTLLHCDCVAWPLVMSTEQDCPAYFDIANLGASSRANEIFVTVFCVANSAKFAFFIWWALFYGALGGVSLFCLVREIRTAAARAARDAVPPAGEATWIDYEERRRYQQRLTFKKVIFGLVALAAFSEFGCQMLFLLAVQSPARYVLYAAGDIAIHFAVSAMFRTFSRVVGGLVGMSSPGALARLEQSFRTSLTLGDCLACATHLAFLFLMPVISYTLGLDGYVNLAYLIWNSLQGALRCWMTAWFVVFSRRVLSSSASATAADRVTSPEVLRFRSKLSSLITVALSFLPVQVGLFLLPLYLLYPGPMLPGIFYVHFTVGQLMVTVSGTALVYLLLREARSLGLSVAIRRIIMGPVTPHSSE